MLLLNDSVTDRQSVRPNSKQAISRMTVLQQRVDAKRRNQMITEAMIGGYTNCSHLLNILSVIKRRSDFVNCRRLGQVNSHRVRVLRIELGRRQRSLAHTDLL